MKTITTTYQTIRVTIYYNNKYKYFDSYGIPFLYTKTQTLKDIPQEFIKQLDL